MNVSWDNECFLGQWAGSFLSGSLLSVSTLSGESAASENSFIFDEYISFGAVILSLIDCLI